MALRINFLKISAQRLLDFSKLVVDSCLANPLFNSFKPDVLVLKTLNAALAASILPLASRNHMTDSFMILAKYDVETQLEVVRRKAEVVCGGDIQKEALTGYTPTKQGRSRRMSIAPAIVASALTFGVKGMLRITLKATVPGNHGYEVHCVHNGVDSIVGICKLQNKRLSFICGNFPSLVPIDIYLITIGPGPLRSVPSNTVPTSAM